MRISQNTGGVGGDRGAYSAAVVAGQAQGLGGGVGHCVSHQASNPHCDRHVEAVAMLADLVVQVRLNRDLDQSAVVVFAGGHADVSPNIDSDACTSVGIGGYC